MINESHLESMKEELASYQLKISQFAADNNRLRGALLSISEMPSIIDDANSLTALNALNKTKEQSLCENNALIIERLIYSGYKAFAQDEVIEKLNQYADDLRKS